MNRSEALQAIATQAGRGELVFPTSVDVALKVQRALDNPDCHTEAAAKLVQTEPLLSARVVAMANSVVYNRAGREITDVRSAVARLGFRTLRSLAGAVVTRQMAGTSADPKLRAISARLWEHTAHVAALAHVIARRVTKQDPETAFFAGIIHEVGGFYLISRAKDFPGILEGDPAEWAEHAEAEVGRTVLATLGVPDPVKEAIEGLWEGYLALPPSSLSDTLLLANTLAPVPSPLNQPPDEKIGNNAPIIDTDIDEMTLSSIIEESKAEVQSLIDALKF